MPRWKAVDDAQRRTRQAAFARPPRSGAPSPAASRASAALRCGHEKASSQATGMRPAVVSERTRAAVYAWRGGGRAEAGAGGGMRGAACRRRVQRVTGKRHVQRVAGVHASGGQAVKRVEVNHLPTNNYYVALTDARDLPEKKITKEATGNNGNENQPGYAWRKWR